MVVCFALTYTFTCLLLLARFLIRLFGSFLTGLFRFSLSFLTRFFSRLLTRLFRGLFTRLLARFLTSLLTSLLTSFLCLAGLLDCLGIGDLLTLDGGDVLADLVEVLGQALVLQVLLADLVLALGAGRGDLA